MINLWLSGSYEINEHSEQSVFLLEHFFLFSDQLLMFVSVPAKASVLCISDCGLSRLSFQPKFWHCRENGPHVGSGAVV